MKRLLSLILILVCFTLPARADSSETIRGDGYFLKRDPETDEWRLFSDVGGEPILDYFWSEIETTFHRPGIGNTS